MPDQFLINPNPFAHIMGPSYAPHAPTLRRTFLEKIESSWDLFFGKSFIQDKAMYPKSDFGQIRLGLLDYLTLGLRPLSEMGLIFACYLILDDEHSAFVNGMGALLFVFSLPIQLSVLLVNATISAVMTLVSTLFVTPFVHLVTSHLVKKDLDEVMNFDATLSGRESINVEGVVANARRRQLNDKGSLLQVMQSTDLEGISLDNCVTVLSDGVLARKENVARNRGGQFTLDNCPPVITITNVGRLSFLRTRFAPGETSETEQCRNHAASLPPARPLNEFDTSNSEKRL